MRISWPALLPLLPLAFASFVACEDPKVPETSCKVVPPQTSDASASHEQAAKLNAKVVNMPVEGSAEAENRAEAQITETYQTIADKQAACAMLFQTIECLERRTPNSPIAAKLADNVGSLCAGTPPPAPSTAPASSSASTAGTGAPTSTTTSTAPTSTGPAPSQTAAPQPSVAPVTTVEPGVTKCAIQNCGIAKKASCEVTCRAPQQAQCSCDSCGGALGLPTCLRENCRCQ
jgi:hypothetical protein